MRNGFLLHGSSRWQSLPWRPIPLGLLSGGELVVAVDVERLKVAIQVRPSVSRADDVVHLQAVPIPEGQSTGGAAPLLTPQETGHR